MSIRARTPRRRPRASPSGSALILPAATRLFAERGFNGVTTREIAEAVGLNISTVHHHVGVKRDLYLAVLRSIDIEEQGMIEAFCATATAEVLRDPSRARRLFLSLVDQILDAIATNPDRARLYMRRWLDPPDELLPREAALSLALYEKVRRVIVSGQRLGTIRRDFDLWIFMRSFAWLIYGYFTAGPMTARRWRDDPHRPQNLSAFRRYLHTYTIRMTGLDPSPGKTQRKR